MTSVEIIVPKRATWDMRDAVVAPLVEYNERVGGPSRFETVAVLLRDTASDATVGGLWGKFSYDWLFVELLAVPEALRGQGLGAALLGEAERIAAALGGAGVWLDTYSFQARGFYEKLGYRTFGELPDHPRGGARFFMRKTLAASAAGQD